MVQRHKTHPGLFKFIGIDDEILKEKGFNDIWGVYLAHENYARQLYKNISNISGILDQNASVQTIIFVFILIVRFYLWNQLC